MASAWGQSFGSAWGDAWGTLVTGGLAETVPYLIGQTEAAARIAVGQIYCVTSVVGTEGTVTAQSPSPFTSTVRGRTITITLGGEINSPNGNSRTGLPPYASRE